MDRGIEVIEEPLGIQTPAGSGDGDKQSHDTTNVTPVPPSASCQMRLAIGGRPRQNPGMNPYVTLVETHLRLLREGRQWPLGGWPEPVHSKPSADAPCALIFSPHPDDECIIGGLPLRLQRESGWRVVNVAVTQGSNAARQAARLGELRGACGFLGFDLVTLGDHGLDQVTPKSRAADPAAWAKKVAAISQVLREQQPKVIFFPHADDWNGTHIGVHHLVLDALATLGSAVRLHVMETEYWGQNYRPNLLVESSSAELADLITALSFHVGEVQRNPFHLTLPAWMSNNVRWGGETVGGQGAAAPDFPFGTIYRWREWREGALHSVISGGRVVPSRDRAAALFK